MKIRSYFRFVFILLISIPIIVACTNPSSTQDQPETSTIPSPSSSPSPLPTLTPTPVPDLDIFTDSLLNRWENVSPRFVANLSFDREPKLGSTSIRIWPDPNQSGLHLQHSGVKIEKHNWLDLNLYVNDVKNRQIYVLLKDSDNNTLGQVWLRGTLYTGNNQLIPKQWQKFKIPLEDLGALDKDIGSIIINDASGKELYVDEIHFSAWPGRQTAMITPLPSETPAPPPTLVPLEKRIKGISFDSHVTGTYDHSSSDLILEKIIKPIGVNWVRIHFMCQQDNIHSTDIYCSSQSGAPTKQEIAHAIRKAHNLGLRVHIEIGIELENDPSHFAGNIGQGFTEQQWEDWFEGYQKFIAEFAKFAEENDVDMLSVGAELISTTHREREWRSLIRAVRDEYTGWLTYSSTPMYGRPYFEAFNEITWWDAVDLIGVHPYDYIYSDKNNPSVDEMIANLQPMVREFEKLSKKYNRPVLITELFLVSLDEINLGREAVYDDPYFKLDVQEQADIYQAYIEAFQEKHWWKGAIFAPVTTENVNADPSNFHAGIIGKPAENVMRSFTGTSSKPTSTPYPTPDFENSTELDIYGDSLNPRIYHYPPNPSYINFEQNKVAMSGNAIEANLPAWKGLLFQKSPYFEITEYDWLEFDIYLPQTVVSGPGWHQYDPVSIKVQLKDENFRNSTPFVVDLAYSQFVEGGHLKPNRWQHVLIPIDAFGPLTKPVYEIVISNNTRRAPIQLYIDNLSLIRDRPMP